MSTREALEPTFFGWLASRFPTHLVPRSEFLKAVWRVLFYVLRPRRPFVMRTPHYRLVVYPDRTSLSRSVIRRCNWEPLQTAVILTLIDPGTVFIDGGANFGHYALAASPALGPGGKVVAFEPHRTAFAELECNVNLQKLKNIQIENAALNDRSGPVRFYSDLLNPGGHSFAAANLWAGSSWEIANAVVLDEFLAAAAFRRRVGFIKSDCQGAEPNVLRGASHTLARDRPYLALEYWPKGIAGCGEDRQEMLGRLARHRYRPFRLDEARGVIVAVSYERLEVEPSPDSVAHFDLLMIPEERVETASTRLAGLLGRPLE